ncbi:MAG: hypothetical protein RJA86_42 [Pseudomonadota bacterium]|jgi:hypothetical protein|nr:hypothetical protein FK216_15720 [Moraxellaceae bacterium AER2_44_116]
MNNTRILPSSFKALAQLDLRGLRAAHAHGRCPDPGELDGVAEGLILDPVWFERLRLWRGKVFHSDGWGQASGINRLGVGSFEFRRYQFNARKQRSAFSDRDIVLLDHNRPDNPWWVRAYHDELVEMRSGLYLTCSHLRINGQLRYTSYFAFDFGQKEL